MAAAAAPAMLCYVTRPDAVLMEVEVEAKANGEDCLNQVRTGGPGPHPEAEGPRSVSGARCLPGAPRRCSGGPGERAPGARLEPPPPRGRGARRARMWGTEDARARDPGAAGVAGTAGSCHPVP